MTPAYHLYVDDSGSRDLDRDAAQDGSKWFALGGILIAEEQEEAARLAHARFCEAWNISTPLHSYDIRTRTHGFAWLRSASDAKRNEFYAQLSQFLLSLPVLGMACVIDRPGYNARYREKYGTRRWALCKTAFTILAERSAKFAHREERRLKIFFERCSKKHDRAIEGYFQAMRAEGMPFDSDRSAKYEPFGTDELRHALWDCKRKDKTSPLVQIADLYLFPLCVAGYDESYRPFVELRSSGRILDCVLDESTRSHIGVKYSCFDAR